MIAEVLTFSVLGALVLWFAWEVYQGRNVTRQWREANKAWKEAAETRGNEWRLKGRTFRTTSEAGDERTRV